MRRPTDQGPFAAFWTPVVAPIVGLGVPARCFEDDSTARERREPAV